MKREPYLDGRATFNEVELDIIEPGKPMRNSYIERFNRSYRKGVLDMYIFATRDEVRFKAEEWLRTYNEVRPHSELCGLTPDDVVANYLKDPDFSILEWY